MLATVVGALLLVAAAGCGGSDDQSSATAQWADGLCSSITDWTTQLKDVGSSLTDTSSLNEEGITSAVGDVVDATRQLADDVKALGPPETESGQQAQAIVQQLADELQASVQTLEDEFAGGVGGLSGALAKMPTVKTTLSTMSEDAQQAFQQLDQLDVGGELKSALEQAGSCAPYTGS